MASTFGALEMDSIDTETEQLIQQGFKAIFQGRISFVIAHRRLSTIRTADRILVIEKGQIIESGTHQELLASKGHYHALYTHQFQQEQEASLFGVGGDFAMRYQPPRRFSLNISTGIE